MLFAVWSNASHRAMRNLDFLSFGNSEIEILVEILREICSIEIEEDGVDFESNSIKGKKFKAERGYEGIHVLALLEKTRIALRIDVGLGNVVEPAAKEIEYPTLLGFPNPKIKIYFKVPVFCLIVI